MIMDHTVYFADKIVRFTARPLGAPYRDVRPAAGETVSRTKVLNFLENDNFLAVVVPDPDTVFETFAADFVAVEAAGGVAVDARGRRLMILRNGRWDLPKGHREAGESVEACAVREVAEETGVGNLRIVSPLCVTLHAYALYGRWELKRTHWFRMQADGVPDVVPQTEEGIVEVRWCSKAEADERLKSAFPTIRCVMQAMG